MTNYGFHTAMREAGIEVATTGVGDRYVLEELRRRGWALGGEQSGHIIDLGFNRSGDGIAAALLTLEALGGEDLADRHAMERLPQRLGRGSGLDTHPHRRSAARGKRDGHRDRQDDREKERPENRFGLTNELAQPRQRQLDERMGRAAPDGVRPHDTGRLMGSDPVPSRHGGAVLSAT